MEKKTLQEIKDNLAIEAGYISWGGYVDSWRGAMPENVIDIIAKAYAKQVETKENQKQLLVDLMKTDQEYGMYDSPKIESTPDSKPDFEVMAVMVGDSIIDWEKMYKNLLEKYEAFQSELSALREERTNHIHEIVRLNEELSKYDSHHP